MNLLTTEPLTFASLTSTDGAFAGMVDRIFDPSVTVSDLEWLRSVWSGPIVVKGVQTAEDARIVVDAGADGIVLSNHCGRQLDRSTTPIEELPAALDEVGDSAEVFIDEGITSGADIVACVAIEATACLIGRSYLYGLLAGGQQGVERVLSILDSEMRRTMQLLGAPEVGRIRSDSVRLRLVAGGGAQITVASRARSVSRPLT